MMLHCCACFLLAFGPLLPPSPQAAEDDLAILTAGGRVAAEAFLRLSEGREGVLGALELLADDGANLDAGARRRLAHLVEKAGRAEDLPAVAGLLDDADGEVRRTLFSWMVLPDHGVQFLAERIQALRKLAGEDPESGLRRRALTALGEFDDPAAAEALVDLALELDAPERRLAAAALRPIATVREPLRKLVRAGFELPPGPGRPADDVLAELVALHGRLLADEPGGGEAARDRAPLVQGLRHPSRAVRRGAEAGFQQLLGRLREAGEVERAERVLGLLAAEGLDARAIRYQESRSALADAADPGEARRAARALRRSPGGAAYDTLFERTLWTFRSLYLEAMAEFADGNPKLALPLLERAGRTLDVVLRERQDLQPNDEARLEHVDALHQRALTHLAVALVRLSMESGQDRGEIEWVRRAHRLSLEAQRGHVRVVGESLATWDNLLDHDLSPLRLCFTLKDLPGLSSDEGLDLQIRLGRLMASVAPREMPGFEPWPGLTEEWSDPLADPPRRAILGEIFEAGLVQVEEELDRLRQRYIRAQIDQPGRLVDPRQERELQRMLRTRARLMETLGTLGEEPEKLLELRIPSSLALWISRDLRAQGRAAEARALGERMRDQVEADPAHARFFWGLQMLARIEMAIGSSFTDEGEGERAEEELLQAVERLEGIEQRLEELGASRRQIATIEAMRSTALVSLAVNANVKLRDPAKALEYYERAYELRQDDFMRVLLACYRARMDRKEEARSLLREIHPHPDLYYNLACTYALLGEHERALDYLEKELEENLASESARQRQREWAREDPDLASLVGDPRFERLLQQ